jgi:hypothetical protein
MLRKILRKLGFNVHKGWTSIHRSGCHIRCIGCGEERMEYLLWVTGDMPSWWETSKSGDGSCGPIPELPIRIY